jgi:hypothetical protein
MNGEPARFSHLLRAVVACTLLLSIGGCFWGMFWPTSIEADLAASAPLRGSASDIRTIAIAFPSTLEAVLGLADSSRGRLDKAALDIGERLQRSGRFTVISPDEYQAALAGVNREADYRTNSTMAEAERKGHILQAARRVKSDAVILLQGKWESVITLGDVTLGRPEYKRHLGMALISTRSGETVWYQEAIVTINEGLATPQEPDIRDTVVSRLVENFLETVR